ncbi:MAG: diadenylate cyclase [Desulfobacterales bacterium]|jgi:DNA integrity scanning protein DisA with diadenylate cyclase activity
MNSQDDESRLIQEDEFKEKLEELKRRIICLCQIIPGLKQCAHLSSHLQELFELRKGLNLLEQGLLQTHLRCCIDPGLKIPGEVVLSVSKLSARRHGAIIVIEQEDNLDDYLQGGVIIDAVVSASILESIFYPGSQLHDGAVCIRNTRVIKAGCLLPFASTPSGLENLDLGTRHQAAVGLSQVSDALVIVVSEEKGWISLALRGRLYPNIGTSALLQKLENPESQTEIE